MRKVEIATKDGKYGILDDGKESVPYCHPTKDSAIEEWGYFERLNTSEEPHRRFLNHVTPVEVIEEIINKLRTSHELR
jgi:hypothetical protein